MRRVASRPPPGHLGLEFLAALAVVTIAGCDSGNNPAPAPPGSGGSGDISTHDIRIWATVEVMDDSMAEVTVELTGRPEPQARLVPIPPNYVLTNGDQLSACVADECTPLRNSSRWEHTGALPYVGGAVYTIAFSRPAHVSALNSVVTLPVPIAILSPPAGLPVTDGQMITIQWSPLNSGSASVGSRAHCDHERGAQSERRASLAFIRPDTGTATFSIDEVFDGWVVDPPLTQRPVLRCAIVLEVSHGAAGTVDSAFLGGFIEASVTRSVTLDYTPSRP